MPMGCHLAAGLMAGQRLPHVRRPGVDDIADSTPVEACLRRAGEERPSENKQSHISPVPPPPPPSALSLSHSYFEPMMQHGDASNQAAA